MLISTEWEVTETPAKRNLRVERTQLMLKAMNILALDGFEGDRSSSVEALSQHSTEQLHDIVKVLHDQSTKEF